MITQWMLYEVLKITFRFVLLLDFSEQESLFERYGEYTRWVASHTDSSVGIEEFFTNDFCFLHADKEVAYGMKGNCVCMAGGLSNN